MKLNLICSSVLHIVLFGLFFVSKATPRKFEGYPTVVPVELVQLKPVAYEAPEVQKAQPRTVEPKATPKKLEGVTLEKPELKQEEPEEVITKTEPPRDAVREKQPKKVEESKKETSVVGTEKVKLDAQEFPFSYYLALLQSRIQTNWEPPYDDRRAAFSKKVIMFFKIQRSGRITEIAVETGSGDYLFDQAAIRAISLSNPLAPLPVDFPKAFLGVHFEFEQGR